MKVMADSTGNKPIPSNIRLNREIMLMKKHPPPGISCYPNEETVMNVLTANIIGATGSPYEKGIFQLEVVITERYPFEPPRVRFVTPVYHPNVDAAGRICLDMLKMPPGGSWRPTLTIEGLLKSIQYLITNPNPDDPLMPEIASQYKYNKDQFFKEAEEWTIKHACSNAVSPCIPANQPKPSDEIEADLEKKRKTDITIEDNSDMSKRQKLN